MEAVETRRKIRLLIVEDHPAMRAGIRALLRPAGDIEVVAEAADGAQAVELANQHSPDFMLLDMELPVLRGDGVLRQVRKSHPEIRVLALSSYNDPAYVQDMLAGGARGYILKEEAPTLLINAIRSIHKNGTGAWLSPKTAARVAARSTREETLSWREIAILEDLLEGRSQADIAAALDLTDAQLAERLRLLMYKFHVTTLEALSETARQTLPPGS